MTDRTEQAEAIIGSWSDGKLTRKDAQVDLLALVERHRMSESELADTLVYGACGCGWALASENCDGSLGERRRKLWDQITALAFDEIHRLDKETSDRLGMGSSTSDEDGGAEEPML